MPTELTGAAIWRATITAPASGDARSAASVATMGQDLADSIAYLNAQDAANLATLRAEAQDNYDILDGRLVGLDALVDPLNSYLTGLNRPPFQAITVVGNGTQASPWKTATAGATTSLATIAPGFHASRAPSDRYLINLEFNVASSSAVGTALEDTYLTVTNNSGFATQTIKCGHARASGAVICVARSWSIVDGRSAEDFGTDPTFTLELTVASGAPDVDVIDLSFSALRICAPPT